MTIDEHVDRFGRLPHSETCDCGYGTFPTEDCLRRLLCLVAAEELERQATRARQVGGPESGDIAEMLRDRAAELAPSVLAP